MAQNFSTQININGKPMAAIIVPELRKDGMYYEVNIKNYPRFFMSWSALGRYDIAPGQEAELPYEVVLAVSDAIEDKARKGR